MSFFPYNSIRPEQQKLIDDIKTALNEKKHLFAHAPTGLGKTAAALAPAVEYAIQNKKTVIFITPRHTQHQIAIKTIAQIREKTKIPVNVVDFIGKRWMCMIPGITTLTSRDFLEFCKEMRNEERCDFYNNTKKGKGLTKEAENALRSIQQEGPLHVEELCKRCGEFKLCPYEMAGELGKNAEVIIADYYHLFHPKVRKTFLKKINKNIEDCIVIIDEAQNLPSKIRDILSSSISNFSIKRAINEASKFEQLQTITSLEKIKDALNNFNSKLDNENEIKIGKEEFIKKIEDKEENYHLLADELIEIGDKIRTENKTSSIGAAGTFLKDWLSEGEEYLRYLKRDSFKNNEMLVLSIRCLYPGNSAKDILDNCHSAILMSGTLAPTQMYRDLLGVKEERAICKIYQNPFPKENRLTLIIPDTTTKFTRRGDEEFIKIAKWTADAANAIPGNVAVFFPSYYLKNEISKFFERHSKKSIFFEEQNLTKEERQNTLEDFKSYSHVGAVLLGVMGGSFGEGIDLPGKLLNGVIIVGVPLKTPDLETKSLIEYYDKLFKAGWDYAYISPAMNLVIQAAGRAIRKDTDRGAIILIDERFTWNSYYKNLPPDWKVIVTMEPVRRINDFFKNDSS